MKRWQLVMGGLAAIAMCSVAVLRAEDDDEAKAKFPVKVIMAKCMKSGLCKKVADGKASAEETKTLVAMLSELPKNKAPKGDADSWKTKTAAVAEAVKAVAEGKEGAGAALAKAANCAACHKEHKPAT
ncbi:MAG: hypothetical protein WD875_17645 [Pirellulales bacterium]